MPGLNWDVFRNLPGSAEHNFEMLCRAAVKRHYAQFGTFSALAMQPGVEFHIKLESDCDLGRRGRWYGWQCRWYDLPKGKPLGATRRGKIREAVSKTHYHLPKLTDWVLWTRSPLTKSDQAWLKNIQTKMRVHQWTEADVDELLSGPAEIFRQTYFGSLILTPQSLERIRSVSIGPIKSRWLPEVHQVTSAQRDILEMLGSGDVLGEIASLHAGLKGYLSDIKAESSQVPRLLKPAFKEFTEQAAGGLNVLEGIQQIGTAGDLELLRETLLQGAPVVSKDIALLPSRLRGANLRAGLYATNAVAILHDLPPLFERVGSSLSTSLAIVVANAGCGKTQLAAELTAASGDRPPGIFLHGRDLSAGDDINDVAHNVVVSGTPCASFEALIAAADGAGRRSQSRLIIAIDGLNEAEDPRAWRSILAQAAVLAAEYPYVLLVGTVRSDFVDDAIPADAKRIELPDFGPDTYDAIRRYFRHYLIRVGDAELPIDLLRHPLTLRIFCEVSNPERKNEVSLSSAPASLAALFERYLDMSIKRVAQLSRASYRHYEQDVRSALAKIGVALWESRRRTVDYDSFRSLLGEDNLPWDRSLIRALEQEGIFLKFPRRSTGGYEYAASYDALAGHLIADAVLTREGASGFESWISNAATTAALSREGQNRHPLASDIFSSLVALVPRRLHRKQLWVLLVEPLRESALWRTMDLESAFLDSATVQALGALLLASAKHRRFLFDRLYRVRRVPGHPLNATFLTVVLTQMSLCDRDLAWTEWLRENFADVMRDLDDAQKRWRNLVARRSEEDNLLARWFSWCLASTSYEIRNAATRALYWFGWGSPTALFKMTLGVQSGNDLYIRERMLAASYGVCMALHARPKRAQFRTKVLPTFARRIFGALFATDAQFRTTHVLARDYARRIIDLAMSYSQVLTSEERTLATPPYPGPVPIGWQETDDPNANLYREGNAPLGMDFRNYTIGSLVPGRRNYDFEHPEYKAVLRRIIWRIYDLGYSLKAFGDIDANIEFKRHRPWEKARSAERYGKKYARIAYLEQFGIREDQGLLDSEWKAGFQKPDESDIDPSFPDPPLQLKLIPDILGNRRKSVKRWVQGSSGKGLEHFVSAVKLGEQAGPWIMLDGFCGQQDKSADRIAFVRYQSFILRKADTSRFLELMSKEKARGRWMPDTPTDSHTFLGEIPWCETFPKANPTTVDFVVGRRNKRVPADDPFYQLRIDGSVIGGEDLAIEPSVPEFELVEVDIIESVPVLIPVRTISLATEAQDEHVSGLMPARELMQFSGSRVDLPYWKTMDQRGVVHSISTEIGAHLNNEHYLFHRKEELDKFLRKQRSTLVWVIWGERQHYSERRTMTSKHHGYKYFQTYLLYQPH